MHEAVETTLLMILSACALGCSGPRAKTEPFPTLPIRYETERLEIGTSFEEPLCGRDLRRLDEHVVRVEAMLGVEQDEPRTIFIYENRPVPGCSPDANGCFDAATGIAAGLHGTISHELVHSIDVEFGAPADFWNEGIAEALSEVPLVYEDADLVDLSDAPTPEFSYTVAGHFVRWLIEWRGVDTFLEFFASGEFENTYGMSLAATEATYDVMAPEVLPPARACDELALELGPDGSLDMDIALDCSDPSVARLGHGYELQFIASVHKFDVAQEDVFSVRLDGGYALLISGCQNTAGPRLDRLGDALGETAEPLGWSYLEPDIDHQVRLLPATYRVLVVADDSQPASAQLRIERQ